MDIFSDVLEFHNVIGWTQLKDANSAMGIEKLLDNAEDFGRLLASLINLNTQLSLSRRNIGMACCIKH